MNIAIVGTGYVGLVTGTCFAEMGNQVTCVDINVDKVEKLRQGVIPIYEPGLEEMVERNVAGDRLVFTTSIEDALAKAEAVFIAVGTPPGEDGSADLTHVLTVARDIGCHLDSYIVVVDKSTVPVGTGDKVRATIQEELDRRGVQVEFDVVSNPEFLAEGVAINDFMRPDRVIIGTDSERAAETMHDLYAPFCRAREKIIVMGIRDAEMTKYAANAMLATRISFMNEIAGICERLGVDIEMVRQGVGSDPRIGHRFLYSGAGYGGSCFPKDVKALIHMAERIDFEPKVLNAVEERNAAQKQVLFKKLKQHFGDLKGKVIAVWGLAFKPGTDDMREAPSLVLIDSLIAAGAEVRAFDPVAVISARRGFQQLNEQYEALEGADALVLITEWRQFRQPDFGRISFALRHKVIVDGRNQYHADELRQHGIVYYGIGR